MTQKKYEWAAPGDVNAFFGLMLDNIADLLLTVTLLQVTVEFPTTFALCYMVPGTAIGVFVGDILFFVMAIRLAKRTGRTNVTAMPLGLDTPSTFGMVFFVLGPAFTAAKAAGMSVEDAAFHTWHIGICAIFISGIFKFICAAGSNWIRSLVPRAGLLGSLAAIALVLISFLPLMEVLEHPIVGLVSFAVILTALVARIPLPFKIPGALAGMIVGGGLYYFMQATGTLGHTPEQTFDPTTGLLPTEWLTVFQFKWLSAMGATVPYLPVIIPFALGTVVGGIDCTESAAAAGDEFDTGKVIAVEAFATLVASLCGGVIQTTPYIGHPAYKAMGGRAAYTLATALFVGSAGVIGYFGYMYAIIPRPTVFPILVFIGLEITAQSFHATPRRHFPAIGLACIPALAFLAINMPNQILGPNPPPAHLANKMLTLQMLQSGFIVTSLLWASALAAIIDRNLVRGAVHFFICSGLTLFGVIHSPLPDGSMFFPWSDIAHIDHTLRYAIGYAILAVLLVVWNEWVKRSGIELPRLEHDH